MNSEKLRSTLLTPKPKMQKKRRIEPAFTPHGQMPEADIEALAKLYCQWMIRLYLERRAAPRLEAV